MISLLCVIAYNLALAYCTPFSLNHGDGISTKVASTMAETGMKESGYSLILSSHMSSWIPQLKTIYQQAIFPQSHCFGILTIDYSKQWYELLKGNQKAILRD